MALTSSIRIIVSATESLSLDLGTRTAPIQLARAISLATGTGNGQADLIFSDQRTLGISATEDLDVFASLTGAFGNTLSFARIKALVVYAATGNTNNVNVIRPAAASAPIFLAASDGVAVR